MNIFFDVDYTILAVDGSLRPGTREVFQQLEADGHQLFVWSGLGVRTTDVVKHRLKAYVAGVFEKPLQDFEAGLQSLGVTPRPDFVIDDYPEIVNVFGGAQVRPYYFPTPSDHEIEGVYRIVTDYVLKGRCFELESTSLPLPRHVHNRLCRVIACAKGAGGPLPGPDENGVAPTPQ